MTTKWTKLNFNNLGLALRKALKVTGIWPIGKTLKLEGFNDIFQYLQKLRKENLEEESLLPPVPNRVKSHARSLTLIFKPLSFSFISKAQWLRWGVLLFDAYPRYSSKWLKVFLSFAQNMNMAYKAFSIFYDNDINKPSLNPSNMLTTYDIIIPKLPFRCSKQQIRK